MKHIISASIALIVLLLLSTADIALAGISPGSSTKISGTHGKECSSTNPQYMLNSGGATLRTYPKRTWFTVESAPNGVWADPYITAGINDSVSSEVCNSHAVPGTRTYYRSYALPIPYRRDGAPFVSIHTRTPAEFIGNAGLDIWLTRNPANSSYRAIANQGANTTEIMIWTQHPGLAPFSSNLRYYPYTIDGHRWAIAIGLAANGHGHDSEHPDGWNLVDFIAPPIRNGSVYARRIELNKFLAYAEKHRWLNPNDYLMSVNGGFEIAQNGASAQLQGFNLWNLS